MCLPWRTNRIQCGNDARNVNGSPCRDFNFRDQNAYWKNDTKEEKSDHVSDDFSHKEKAIDHVHLFPYSHFLYNPKITLKNDNDKNNENTYK